MNMPREYDVGPFSDVAGAWGNRLWSFLNEAGVLALMRDASDIKKPAAEAIGDELIQRFGNDIKRDRVKQFTGLLIRQVMEKMDIGILPMA